MKTNKKSNKKSNAKTAKAAKPKAAKQAVKCVLCGAEVKGHGNNPAPLAESGVCCDECNAKVIEARVKEAEYETACREAAKAEADQLAKRREYAKNYYAANRAKLVEASKRSHAKRAAEAKALLNETCDILQGIASEHGYEWFAKYGDPSAVTRLAEFLRRA